MARVLKYNEAMLKIGLLIQNSRLEVGDKLPNEQEIAARLGMSIAPVRQALAAMQNHGIICKRPGVGTFYCGNIHVDRFQSNVGVVNVADRFYPDGRTSYELRRESAKHLSGCEIFSVPADVEPGVLNDLSRCDRFLVTGFVTPSWVEYLQSLNKPIVQLGNSAYEAKLCRVEFDWSHGMELAVKAMRDVGCKRLKFLAPDPQYNSHAVAMRNHFFAAMEACDMPLDKESAPMFPYASTTARIAEMFDHVDQLPDAFIVIEPGGDLFPLLLAMCSKQPRVMPRLVIIQQMNHLTPDCEAVFPNLYNVLYEESLIEVAMRILFEYPYQYIDECQVYRIKASIGHGRELLPIPYPMPE